MLILRLRSSRPASHAGVFDDACSGGGLTGMIEALTCASLVLKFGADTLEELIETTVVGIGSARYSPVWVVHARHCEEVVGLMTEASRYVWRGSTQCLRPRFRSSRMVGSNSENAGELNSRRWERLDGRKHVELSTYEVVRQTGLNFKVSVCLSQLDVAQLQSGRTRWSGRVKSRRRW